MFPVSSCQIRSILLGAGMILGLSSPVLAQTVPPASITYSITHNFTFNVGGNAIPGVRGFDGGNVFASSPFSLPPFASNSYGPHSYIISPPLPVLPFTHTHSTSASSGLALANASSTVKVNTITPTGIVSGLINASGNASAGQQRERACASSFAGINVRQRVLLPSGTIGWGPAFAWDFVRGSGCGVRRDPIAFSVTDPDTGAVLSEGQFLDVTGTGDGSVEWGQDALNFDMGDGTFRITLDSIYIPESQRGTLVLEVNNGIITRSEDTGRFDGWLPGVGSSGKFSIASTTGTPFNPNLDFSYNLGDFGKEVDLTLTADGGVIDSVPEPSMVTPLGLGVLGLVGQVARL